ncbi:MAG: hypothetical protein U9N84_08295 [Actinomycetota bacterium]|nr:hypothetical protein [Actinomycetota bacterium]
MNLMRLAGVLVSLGAAMMFTKGVLLAVTGHDRSLVPWFGLFASVGFAVAALALWRSVDRGRWLAAVGAVAANLSLVGSVVAVGYLLSGTIPESDNASAAVGGSYVVLTAGVVVALVSLGIVILMNRVLAGRWRWLPLGLIVVQLPIFIVAGAVGDGLGSPDLTDGLGLMLTGVAWMTLGYALSQKSTVRTEPLPAST